MDFFGFEKKQFALIKGENNTNEPNNQSTLETAQGLSMPLKDVPSMSRFNLQEYAILA
jgi:hypothetical protein